MHWQNSLWTVRQRHGPPFTVSLSIKRTATLSRCLSLYSVFIRACQLSYPSDLLVWSASHLIADYTDHVKTTSILPPESAFGYQNCVIKECRDGTEREKKKAEYMVWRLSPNLTERFFCSTYSQWNIIMPNTVQAFNDLSLLYSKNVLHSYGKKHSYTKHYSIVKTDVIKLSIRKVNLLYILKAKLHIFESIWRLFINNAKDLDLTDDQVNAKFLWTTQFSELVEFV